jgi:hypothetical protein
MLFSLPNNYLSCSISPIDEGAELDHPHHNIWSIPGGVGTAWCPWSSVEKADWQDLLEAEDVKNIWPPERIEAIVENGEKPTPDEVDQWHRAYCISVARNYPETEHVWITPLTAPSGTTGWALIETSSGYPHDRPRCIGVFASVSEAKALVEREGAIHGWG